MNIIEKKICSSCSNEKQIGSFGKNKQQADGHHYYCKECIKQKTGSRKEKNKLYYKQWSERNKDDIKAYQKKYKKDNREEINAYQRNRPLDKKRKGNCSEKKKLTQKQRRQQEVHKDQRRANEKKKYMMDIQFQTKKQLEARLRVLFVKNDTTVKSVSLIGCTIPEFKAYLEVLFHSTMTWENYGVDWEFSHIKPFSEFDLTDLEEQKRCLHFSNILPLFKTTRIIDGIEYVGNLNKERFLE